VAKALTEECQTDEIKQGTYKTGEGISVGRTGVFETDSQTGTSNNVAIRLTTTTTFHTKDMNTNQKNKNQSNLAKGGIYLCGNSNQLLVSIRQVAAAICNCMFSL